VKEGERGIHHVSSIVGDAQRNLGFYAGVLGLRLVKLTVNYDDPGTYHLYYGNGDGNPGSLVTFFPWGREGAPGRAGLGQVSVVSLSILPSAIAYWVGRLIGHGIPFERPSRRFDEQVLAFRDHDGLQIELVAHPSAEAVGGWAGGPVPPEASIRGVSGVTLLVDSLEPTGKVLTDALGFTPTKSEETRHRFEAGGSGPGNVVDVRSVGGFWEGSMGVGTVHHVAFRARDGDRQSEVRKAALSLGLSATKVLDRTYFQSVYFREPGGVLFECATDGPGFAVDEAPEHLGTSLALPSWLEPDRQAITGRLPILELAAADGTT
jgi:glyoxalase family protein